jgi:hypothetical protein
MVFKFPAHTFTAGGGPSIRCATQGERVGFVVLKIPCAYFYLRRRPFDTLRYSGGTGGVYGF